MQKIVVILLAAALWSVGGSPVLAATDGQVAKEKTLAKSVRAQADKERMMPQPTVQLKRLAKGLLLTKEQQKQIKPMLEEEFVSLKEIRQDENLSPKQIQTKVEELRATTVAKIKTVLTPEQIERYDLVSKEIKANKQRRIQENRKSRLGTKSTSVEGAAKDGGR